MYNFAWEWEAREKEGFVPFPYYTTNLPPIEECWCPQVYEEVTSFRRNMVLLKQLIHHWDHLKKSFRLGTNIWYQPIVEDIPYRVVKERRGFYPIPQSST